MPHISCKSLPVADGRMLADVDIMVPLDRLPEIERRLREAGWQSETLDPYDEHYYREWAHELPPMRYQDEPLELDVHHNILQRTARLQPDPRELFRASIPVETRPFRILCPADQVLHAAVHLFQDSDCANRLRDLVDVDGLVRAHSSHAGFWHELRERACIHGVMRPLWYALHFSSSLLDTPVPAGVLEGIPRARPSTLVRMAMSWLVRQALLPHEPDRRLPVRARLARALLYARSHWLRMPPWLLARHLGAKGIRRLRDATAGGA